MLNFGQAFNYVFSDKKWFAILSIGGLVNLVPVLHFVAVGYQLVVIHHVYQALPHPLPRWKSLGYYFRQGWVLGLAQIIYATPIIISASLATLLGLAAFFAFGAIYIPSGLTGQEAYALFLNLILAASALLSVTLVFSLPVGFLLPAVTLNYLQHGTFSSCFNLWAILRFIGHYPVAYFSLYGALFIAGCATTLIGWVVGAVGGWIPGLINFVVACEAFWLQLVQGHLLGQLSQRANLILASQPAAPVPI